MERDETSLPMTKPAIEPSDATTMPTLESDFDFKTRLDRTEVRYWFMAIELKECVSSSSPTSTLISSAI